VEVELVDACLQANIFAPGSAHARRLALSIKGVEVNPPWVLLMS